MNTLTSTLKQSLQAASQSGAALHALNQAQGGYQSCPAIMCVSPVSINGHKGWNKHYPS